MRQVGLTRTTSEQRAPLYEDVETLLDFGFLTHNVTINGVCFSFRSLGPGDRFLLRHRSHSKAHDEWVCIAIASSIWMVGGYNLLNEDNVVPLMAKSIRKLPPNVRVILFNEVMSMLDRVTAALDAVEPYAYEKVSRYKWKSFGNQPFSSHNELNTKIGTNHVQRMWTFYNQIEDQRVKDDVYWDGIKFATSVHASKGVKKIDDRDKQNRKEEQDRRQRVQDTFFYTVKGVIRKEELDKTKGDLKSGGKSADDLSDEMRRWVSGEADWHDDIVNNYKRMVASNYEKHKQALAEQAAMLAVARDDINSDTPQPIVGYSAQELSEILKERGQGVPGVRQVGGGPEVVREHLYTKFLGREADSGALQVNDGQMVIVSPNDGIPLEQRLEERNVVFRSGGEEPQEPFPSEW